MWFQYLIEFLILIGFIGWKLIVKPIAEDSGIEIDEEKEIKTDHTERLLRTESKYKEKRASVEAVRKEKELKTDIHNMDKEIKETDREIEDL
jgi:hypothetical protein